MKSTATAAADPVLHVEQNVFAWQTGQRTTSRRTFGVRCDLWLRFFDAADVTVEILQTECKLVGIDALGAAAELLAAAVLEPTDS